MLRTAITAIMARNDSGTIASIGPPAGAGHHQPKPDQGGNRDEYGQHAECRQAASQPDGDR
jgi:hypothetical protein